MTEQGPGLISDIVIIEDAMKPHSFYSLSRLSLPSTGSTQPFIDLEVFDEIVTIVIPPTGSMPDPRRPDH